VGGLQRDDTAAQAGVDATFIDQLVELGVLTPDRDGSFATGDVRRARLINSLDRAGISVEDVAAAVHRGDFRLGMFDLESFETRFSPLSQTTFAALSAESHVPLELLMVIREAIGFAQPTPDDLVREDELLIVPAIRFQLDRGFNPATIERWLRVYGDSLRRMAETEGAWWDTEVMAPIFAAGIDIPQRIEDASRWGLDMSRLLESAII
jgi:hypothetical protein